MIRSGENNDYNRDNRGGQSKKLKIISRPEKLGSLSPSERETTVYWLRAAVVWIRFQKWELWRRVLMTLRISCCRRRRRRRWCRSARSTVPCFWNRLLFLPFLVLFETNHLLKNGFSYILKKISSSLWNKVALLNVSQRGCRSNGWKVPVTGWWVRDRERKNPRKIPGRQTLVTWHCCGDTAASLSDLNERQRS